MFGGEFVMTKKEDFTAKTVDKFIPGNCCAIGKYTTAESSCNITPDATMKKSTVWKQPEMAIANCPNVTKFCDTKTPLIDLDAESGPVTRVTGKDG